MGISGTYLEHFKRNGKCLKPQSEKCPRRRPLAVMDGWMDTVAAAAQSVLDCLGGSPGLRDRPRMQSGLRSCRAREALSVSPSGEPQVLSLDSGKWVAHICTFLGPLRH